MCGLAGFIAHINRRISVNKQTCKYSSHIINELPLIFPRIPPTEVGSAFTSHRSATSSIRQYLAKDWTHDACFKYKNCHMYSLKYSSDINPQVEA